MTTSEEPRLPASPEGAAESATAAADPRARRRDLVRLHILEQAADIVLEEGVDALSMRRVAERAEYTVGALYRYYPSVDALIADVTLQVLERLAEAFARAVEAEATGLRAVCRLIDVYRGFAVEDPHGFALLTTLVATRRFLVEDAERVGEIALAVRGAFAPLQEALDQAVSDGDLDPPPAGAGPAARPLALFAALQGALQLHKLARRAPGLVDADATALEVVVALLIGWGALPAALVFAPPNSSS
ncbi:MAG: TetR/AcrR family transcriptional regulator [Deltaproteobacteria bacterium]|nr:MAG: TetR/AcrR family transcriptional regulator [Deltaproteobacteria bacterium]